MPTLINNVETLTQIPAIIINGAHWYKGLGTEKSPGTKIFTISGDVRRPGHVEVEMGTTLDVLIHDFAGGIPRERPFKTALLGGAAGTFVPASLLDTPMDFESLEAQGAVLGSGAVVVMSEDRSIASMLHSILRFFEHESCGKCVPCRVGTRQLRVLLEQFNHADPDNGARLDALLNQARLMANSSLCPLGQSPVLPVESAIRYFRHELQASQISSSGATYGI